MQSCKEFFQNDRFAVMAGVELITAKDGYARARMRITPEHLNAAGIVQGGAIFTLADLAFAAAANSRGQLAVSLTSSVNFFKGEGSGTLYATARERNLHAKVATYQVDVTNERDELIATLEGTVFRKQTALPVTWE